MSFAQLPTRQQHHPPPLNHNLPAGLLLFTASACGSIALHQLHQRFRSHKDAALSALLAGFALLYGAAAIRLQVMWQGSVGWQAKWRRLRHGQMWM